MMHDPMKSTFSRRVGLMVILAMTLSAIGCAHRTADLVILNARIWTGATRTDGSFSSSSEPTALCVVCDRIQAVGNTAAIARHIGPATKIINAGGRRVIPGITDSHTHIIGGGQQLARLHLRDVGNRSAFIETVAKAVKKTKRGQWVLGGRWSVESWTDPAPPTKAWLDPISGDTPVFLSRMDGHQALVNSTALKLARISASGPPDPPGGEIVRDPRTGEPTGILKETAMELVRSLIPPPSLETRYQDLLRAIAHAHALGITSVHDMSKPDDLDVFLRAHRAGTLTLRITSYLSVCDWPAYTRRVKDFPVHNDRLTVAGFKAYMDGSLGSRTAYMHKPYTDATPEMPYPRGQLNPMANPPEKFIQAVIQADAAGLQIAAHAIGDQANHLLLNAYQAAIDANGRHDARHRVEHAQHLMVKDIARFADLGVVASMQPFHKADDGRYAEQRIGPDRLDGSYAYRKLLDSGALLCFGSDFPVVTINPFKGIDSAVNARTVEGKVWLPSHSLTLEEALRAYTVSPPKAIHRDDRLGTLEPGKLADLVILDDDPFVQPIEQVGQTQVWRTIVGGTTVYTRE